MADSMTLTSQAEEMPGRLLLLLVWNPGSRLEQRLRPIADIVVVVGWGAARAWLERERFDAVVIEADDAVALNCAENELRGRSETVICITPTHLVSDVLPPLMGVNHGPALSNEIVRVLRGTAGT